MKKILVICLLMLAVQVEAKNKYEPECKVSGFNNETICFVKPYGTWVDNKKTALSFVSFGGTWTSTAPENVGLSIFYGDAATNIKSIAFNIDGNITEFNVDVLSNKVSRQGRLSNTTALAIIPVDYLQQLVQAKNAKYRVSTISDGYREGAFYSVKGVASEPITTLKALLDRVQ